MRWNVDPRLVAVWLFVVALARLETVAARAGEPEGRMAAIVAALRVEEARYADVEYVARITTRKPDPTDPANATEVTSMATRRVVLQWDRISFRSDSFERAAGAKVHREEVSAYDGERTVTVVAGNCVNIHLGRFEHPDIASVHCLPLAEYRVNVPLSVYLSGTEAIHAHPRYPRFVGERGSAYEFPRVEAYFEGEEEIGGLRCVKVRVDRWQYSRNVPARQHLWLAPGRNYHCVREQVSRPSTTTDDLPIHEMRVENLREVAPGIWFPTKITVVNYDVQALRQMKKVVAYRTETVVDKVDLAPHHDDAFFRDVAIPAGLPVFTIKDRALVASALPEPAGGDREPAKRAEVIAQVAEQEKRYNDLEVKARVNYRSLRRGLARGGVIDVLSLEEHSIARGSLGFFESHAAQATAGGQRSEQLQISACDGQWTQTFVRSDTGGQRAQYGVSLRKVRTEAAESRRDVILLLRPHTLLNRYDGTDGPLGDVLASPSSGENGRSRVRFRYCGDQEVDGHPCIKLRGDVLPAGRDQPHSSYVLFLAADRNDIPIRIEHYGGNFGYRPMPAGIGRCDDLREIAPGVWYPFRVTELGFDNWIAAAQGWVVLNWRRDATIESAALAPKVDEAVFRGAIVPAGTPVQVSDEDGQFVGRFQQAEEGIPALTPAGYLKLLSQAQVPPTEQLARQRAMDALIGRPAPEFPAGAAWLSGQPLTWKALRGRVVILHFWAEWNEPCRDDLARLVRLHQDRAQNGLTIIGIHPPGSEPDAIRKVIDACRLEFPICIDVPPAGGTRAWGELFGRFAVRAIPHAVAVDADGKVVACGRLEDVLERAEALVKKGR